MYGVIHKIIKDDALAEDALQECFIKIWRYSKKYDSSKAKLFTWLYRIARNTAIDKLRSNSKKFDTEIQINNSNDYYFNVRYIKKINKLGVARFNLNF